MEPPVESRYSRQELFFPHGAIDQQKLGKSRVVVLGCGALGTVVAGHLARAGVGQLRIVDRDFVDSTNLQRQTLFDEADVADAMPKAVAAQRKLRLINSSIEIEALVEDFDPSNAQRLLANVDLIMDGSDNFEARYLLNDVAVKHGLPWVYSAVVSGYGVTMTVRPGQTPCLSCVFPEQPALGATATCDTAGVIGPIVGVVGSLAAAEALKLLVGAAEKLRVGLLWTDVWNNTVQETPLAEPDPGCRTCARREFRYLNAESGSRTAVLCGRDAIQIRPATPASLRLADIGSRLGGLGRVSVNDYLLQFQVGEVAMTLFPDGRAIIKGTSDPSAARSVYARYVGA